MANGMIDPRLYSAASFVRAGAVLADIGTDHGYLPVFLLGTGRIKRAYLSDVNEGPLSSAAANVREAGLCDKCELILADGAETLAGRGVTDYAICGMGGELIADIISRAPHLCDPALRLILQPMSRQEHLRRALYALGFTIVGERYSASDGKYYVCIAAEYTATPCQLSDALAYLGPQTEHRDDMDAYLGYLDLKRKGLARAVLGREQAGEPDSALSEALALVDEQITRLNGSKQKGTTYDG